MGIANEHVAAMIDGHVFARFGPSNGSKTYGSPVTGMCHTSSPAKNRSPFGATASPPAPSDAVLELEQHDRSTAADRVLLDLDHKVVGDIEVTVAVPSQAITARGSPRVHHHRPWPRRASRRERSQGCCWRQDSAPQARAVGRELEPAVRAQAVRRVGENPRLTCGGIDLANPVTR